MFIILSRDLTIPDRVLVRRVSMSRPFTSSPDGLRSRMSRVIEGSRSRIWCPWRLKTTKPTPESLLHRILLFWPLSETIPPSGPSLWQSLYTLLYRDQNPMKNPSTRRLPDRTFNVTDSWRTHGHVFLLWQVYRVLVTYVRHLLTQDRGVSTLCMSRTPTKSVTGFVPLVSGFPPHPSHYFGWVEGGNSRRRDLSSFH